MKVADEFILIERIGTITTDLRSYKVDINQLDVIIKIEVLNGKVNIDNTNYIK